MRDRRLDRLFLRYRSRGDVRALGEVFDASSQELLRVASNLVRDPGEVDDLLQATFLTALERAERWDASRRLMPWLIGILVHHVHDLRRERRREVDPERLEERESESPVDVAERSEAGETLRRAIAELPVAYREVLQLFVERGQRAAEIGAHLGRPPGTVRMQIHRGLDLLRKALPSGIAMGALGITAGRGVAAVREVVMREATHRAPLLAAASTSSGTALLGTLSMTKKALVTTFAVLAASSLVWLAKEAIAQPDELPGADRAEMTAAVPSSNPALGLGAGSSTLELAATDATEREAAASDTSAATGYEQNLAGVTGRLVEADGRPVGQVRIELLELGPERMEQQASSTFLPPTERWNDWAVASATTASDGTFLLRGARPSSLQLIGVDLRGKRPWMKIVDDYLHPGAQTDLGDIVLPPVAPISGRIVDDEGAPIAGARVRAAELNTGGFRWEHFAALDSKTPVLVQQNKYVSVLVEAPIRTQELIESLPFTTTTTAADGTFELAAAPLGELSLLADHADHSSALVRVNSSSPGGGSVGDITLESGLSLTGRLVDAEGVGLEGAEVRGGRVATLYSLLIPDMAALTACATTTANGEFTIRGLPEGSGQLVLVARESERSPWAVHKPEEGTNPKIVLPTRHDVEVHVVDAAGEPVEAELVAFQPSPVAALPLGGLFDPRIPRGTVERTGPGQYVIRDLQKATYTLHARAAGFAIATERVRPRRKARVIEIELEPEVPLTVCVLDAATEAPLEEASVRLFEDRESDKVITSARTDADGRAQLAGVPTKLDGGAYLRISHPRHGSRNLPIEDLEPGELTVRLEPGGAVRVLCRDAGRAPVAPVSIEFSRPALGEFGNDNTRRFLVTDANGDGLATSLPPGEWSWQAGGRYLDGSLWKLMTNDLYFRIAASGTVTVRAGETAEVKIDVQGFKFETPLPRGDASISGTLSLDGEPREGRVSLYYLSRQSYLPRRDPAEGGTFTFANLAPGRYRLEIHVNDGSFGWRRGEPHHSAELEVEKGDALREDLLLRDTKVLVRVVDEDGQPQSGVRARIEHLAPGVTTSTDEAAAEDGEVVLRTRQGGRVRLMARSTTKGVASREVDLVAGEENGPFELRLDPGVTITGTATMDPTASEQWARYHNSPFQATFVPVDEPRGKLQTYLAFTEDDSVEYALAGLSAGRWRVELTTAPMLEPVEPVEFTVGDQDMKVDLAFRFQKR